MLVLAQYLGLQQLPARSAEGRLRLAGRLLSLLHRPLGHHMPAESAHDNKCLSSQKPDIHWNDAYSVSTFYLQNIPSSGSLRTLCSTPNLGKAHKTAYVQLTHAANCHWKEVKGIRSNARSPESPPETVSQLAWALQ